MKADPWRLRAPLGPPLRRAAVAGIPVAATVLLGLDLTGFELAGIGIGALITGFVAFDSPSGRTRAIWQLGAAPFIAVAGALGALTGGEAVLAVATMAVYASASALAIAVSLRLYVAAITTTLALLLAQGLAPHYSDALLVFGLAGAGALVQAAFSAAAALVDRIREDLDITGGVRRARDAVTANLSVGSLAFRHALRWGASLGVGVAAYHLIELGEHGYWIPLTVLFVLRPSAGETWQRIAMRGAGTLAGLAVASPLAQLIGGVTVVEAVVAGAAAALAYALLAIEYALFTASITAFVVVYAHAFGEPAWRAADERALATAVGLGICAVAVYVFRERRPAPLTPPRAGGAGARSAT